MLLPILIIARLTMAIGCSPTLCQSFNASRKACREYNATSGSHVYYMIENDLYWTCPISSNYYCNSNYIETSDPNNFIPYRANCQIRNDSLPCTQAFQCKSKKCIENVCVTQQIKPNGNCIHNINCENDYCCIAGYCIVCKKENITCISDDECDLANGYGCLSNRCAKFFSISEGGYCGTQSLRNYYCQSFFCNYLNLCQNRTELHSLIFNSGVQYSNCSVCTDCQYTDGQNPNNCCNCAFDDQYGWKYCDYGGGEVELISDIVNYIKFYQKGNRQHANMHRLEMLSSETYRNYFNNPATCSFMYWLQSANLSYEVGTLTLYLIILIFI